MKARRVKLLFDLSVKAAQVPGGSSGLGLQIAHALANIVNDTWRHET
jgi:NAD(P)-dependent dehydrogenase (short-subunit alcohol dehydrogenase family)